MSAQLITSGVAYPQFMDELRTMVRQEITHAMAASAAPPPELGGLDLAQVITRLSKPRLYALVSARQIPHTKRGNKLYFNRAELQAWVEEGRRT
jgi:excisionase family DNA binding protein